MGDNVTLKFSHMGQDVDVLVEDIDKAMLMDLVIEYLDMAEKKNHEIPRLPSFSYVNRMTHVDLNNDKDLMKMFSNLEGNKEIHILVEKLDKSTDVFKSALP